MTRKFALIIGNSEYEDTSLARLKTPDADVRSLADALRDPALGGFDEVMEIINQPESAVSRAISTFFTNKKPDDLLLLYFSGHGVLDPQGRLFLAVKDTQRSLLNATAVPASFITDDMDTCRSRRQILILDCCHSGAFAKGSKGDAPAVTKATFEGNGYGRVVLTASDSTQYALEGDQVIQQAALSLFTHYLLEGLTAGSADSDQDGWITLDEWYDYAYERVINETPDQTPRKWVYNQQGELVVARNPRPPQPQELPQELQAALQSQFAGIRLEAVSELRRLLLGGKPALVPAIQQALQQIAEQDDSRRVSMEASQALADFARVEAERQDKGKAEQERLAREKAAAEKLSREQAEKERLTREKAAAEKLAHEKAEQDRLVQKKAAAEKLARERAERERLTHEKAAAEKLAREKAEQESIAREKAAAEKLAREQAERERMASVKSTGGIPSVTAHLSGEILPASESGSLFITNQGAGSVLLDVVFQASNNAIFFNPPRMQARLAPGEGQELNFTARPAAPFYLGAGKRLPFDAIVTAPSGESMSLRGELPARPILPLWAIPAALTVLVLCIGSVALLSAALARGRTAASATQTGEAQQTAIAAVLLGTSSAQKISDEEQTPAIELPTRTPPFQQESTPIETLIHTPELPIISASTTTNCRSGPSVLYIPPIGVLDVNQTSEVHGRNAEGTWWYIQNPSNPSTFCWVWGETTSVHGSTSALPVIVLTQGLADFADWRLAYASNQDGNWDIYIAKADGSEPLRLTDDRRDDSVPVWSPDGRKILFHSDRNGNFDLFVVNYDGSDLDQLTTNPTADTFAIWSPDGSRIAYQSRQEGNKEIFIMNADGSQQTQLTHNSSEESWPTFSADGSSLVYASDRDGNLELYKLDIASGVEQRLTYTDGDEGFPTWSPVGDLLAYTYVSAGTASAASAKLGLQWARFHRASQRLQADALLLGSPPLQVPTTRQDIYLFDFLSGEGRELTTQTTGEDHPRWSLDGRALLFDVDVGGAADLFICEPFAIGCAPRQLTRTSYDEDGPALK